MKAGDVLPIRRLTVTAAPMRDVAKLLRDPNPIHLDAAAAAAAGLGDRVINQGPTNVAYVMDMLMQAFPGFRLERFDCRFVGSVRDGDAVEAGGIVANASGDRVECAVWLRIEGGGDALTATATMARR